jgi:hypothetical protein
MRSVAIDEDILLDVMRHALGDSSALLGAWDVQPLGYDTLSSNAVALLRISGQMPQPWSVIAKIVGPSSAAVDMPQHPFFWRREAMIYQSGLLADLPPGLAVPRLYATNHQPDGSLCIWLEDLGLDTSLWSIDRLALAARQMGRLAAIYLVEEPMPQQTFLSRGAIRAMTADHALLLDSLRDVNIWRDPLLQAAFPASPAEDVLALWQDREFLFKGLERQMQTLAHHDFWRGNLFSRPGYYADDEPETVIIDWEIAGHGAPGEDAGTLLGASLLNFHIDAAEASDAADVILIAYLNGLSDGGWRSDPQPIRFAFNTAAVLRAVFPAVCWPVAITGDLSGEYIEDTQRHWNRPIEAVFAQWAAAAKFLLGRAEDALRFATLK